MKKIVAVINARMKSTRLPGKALLPLAERSSLFHHFQRLSQVKGIDCIYLATSTDKENSPLIKEAEQLKLKIYIGAEEDIVERYMEIGQKESADAMIRCGCDKPLFSYDIANIMVQTYTDDDLLFISDPVPAGLGIEIVSTKAMEITHRHYHGTAISQYMREKPHLFKLKPISVDKLFQRPEYRFCLDTEEDYAFHKCIYDELYDGTPIEPEKLLCFLDDNPSIGRLNQTVNTKEVNIYSQSLNSRPVFSIYLGKEGKYLVLGRDDQPIPYMDFIDLVLDKARWQ
ncbi:MAG: hypothetical protein HQK79_04270 [Desulfobacterales bacterium]|nr:hypothetical protein [Desulfobacterales bacterium]